MHNTRACVCAIMFQKKKKIWSSRMCMQMSVRLSCWRSGNLCLRSTNTSLEKARYWHCRLKISSAEATRKKEPCVESAGAGCRALLRELRFLSHGAPVTESSNLSSSEVPGRHGSCFTNYPGVAHQLCAHIFSPLYA